MIEDILIPLVIIGLAEFGDKSQMALLVLSSKTQKRLPLLIGAVSAFLIVDGIAILAGNWIKDIISIGLIKSISGIIFIIFGILILVNKKEGNVNNFYLKNPFYLSFALIFLLEWGDKTQIAAGLFATKYNSLLVLFGVMGALTILSIMSIYLGKVIQSKIKSTTITKISGILFVLLGLSSLLV